MRENLFPDLFNNRRPNWAARQASQHPIVRQRRRLTWRALRNAGIGLMVGLAGATVSLAMGLAFGMDLI